MSAERLLGYTEEDVQRKNYSIFFSESENRAQIPKKTLAIAAKKGSVTAEGIRVRKDGSHFWARSYVTLVKQEQDLPPLFVLITQDIIKSRAVEQKREEYIGIASHELRNPITTLSLYSELLAQQLRIDSDKKSLNMLRDMQHETARLLTLVDDLLIVNTVEGGKLTLQKTVFKVRTFATRLILDIQKTAPSHTILLARTKERNVRADQKRIAQVLINLIGNAIKYSPSSDTIKVGLEYRKGKCIISVQDFGPGIPKAEQKDIFTRFFRARGAETGAVAGSGLGLYISKEIMKKHGERLSVKSVEGQGTVFSFTLPLAH